MESTTTQAKRPGPLVICDICHREFTLTKQCLTENRVVLEKEGLDPKEVVLTTLECPCCGKQYPVMMDDDKALEMVNKLSSMYQRRMFFLAKSKKIPAKLDKKYRELEHKLGFRRKSLANEYNKSFYQTEDGKQQLDYRYHVR